MSSRKRIILAPSYMKKFSCIGSLCGDSCCIGWRVSLDKDTYLKYKQVQDKELKPIFQKTIGRERSQKNDIIYGKIKMEEGERCPFLDEKRLCKIHGKLGEAYLSDTCTLYPRVVNKVDGKLERSAVVSCPEVARIALLNSQGILLEQREEDLETRIRIDANFDTKGHTYLNKAKRYFWDIRIFSLSLLQNRKYTLGERLIILGIVYRRIESLDSNNEVKSIPLILEDMNKLIENGSFKKEVEKVPTNIQVQLSLAKGIIDLRKKLGINNERYNECITETLAGLNFIEGAEIESIMEVYLENHNNYYSPYIKEKEYILENYLVNEYFKELMPFGKYNSIWDSYVFLCVLYSMVKLHMIGISGYYKGLNDELSLKLIQSFSKVVLHDNQQIQSLIKLLKEEGYTSLAYMAILVKN